jgi:hypothetical protein
MTLLLSAFAQGHPRDDRTGLLGDCLLSRSEIFQRCFPPALKLVRYEPIVGIDAVRPAPRHIVCSS